MLRAKMGGGWAAIWYTIVKSVEASGGPVQFWRRMFSRNACKTCALGMGGQMGGMRNEAGHFPEFCKKSVQAMAADMQPPLADDFFERHSVAELARMSSRELEHLGRLAYPVMLEHGASHYRHISWEEALTQIVGRMKECDPRHAFFYASGRSSNEAAFLLQWLGRVYGTNHIHNCSYYCHQASGVGLSRSVGTGTATVTLEDVGQADFAMVIGANPASNHPRLITQLVEMRERGGKVVIVNPLRELGLDRFSVPSRPKSLLVGSRVHDLYLQPRIGGDIALMKGMLKVLIDEGAIDVPYITSHTDGFEKIRLELERESLEDLAQAAGLRREKIIETARMYARSKGAVFMWAMGITHHEHGVDNVSMIANLALARGMVGRPGAGLMPIRGHSNVQGVGSVGFTPELKSAFLNAMREHYGVEPPEWKGYDSMECVHASERGEMDFGLFLGGNFYAANPDLAYAASALGKLRTAVHINTKLNQGHVSVLPQREGGTVILLPTLTRDEEQQGTTQESMFNFIRFSDGGMKPPAGDLRSELDIVTSIGGRLLPDMGPINFEELRDHQAVRRMIARVVPGYESIERMNVDKKEFYVQGRVRHQPQFPLPEGKARFIAVETPSVVDEGTSLRLMTIRSEGQFNTVVYEEHDRYRGQPDRNVILLHPRDLRALGLNGGDRVTVRSEVGSMKNVRVAPFDIAPGAAAMYYPEANVLVPTRVDPASRTPAYKNVPIQVLRETPDGAREEPKEAVAAE